MKTDLVEKIKSLDIINVANKLGLNITSPRQRIRCVSKQHEDKNPSMGFNTRNQTWKCFGCGKGGDVIELVKEEYGLEFKEACSWLCNAFNINNPFSENSNYVPKKRTKAIKKERPQNDTENKPNPDIYQWIIDSTTLSENAKKFLYKERLLSPDVIESLNIRSIESFNILKAKAEKKWGEEELTKCGFGKGGLAWFRKPIIFPYYNKEGKIIQLQARATEWKEKSERFANLKGIETCMYNMTLLEKLKIGDTVFVCEGVTDCLAALSLGLNSVAIPGISAYKDIYTKYLRPYHIVLIPDNDSAGSKLLSKMRESFDKVNKDFKIFQLPGGYKDFSEYYIKCKNGKLD